MEFTLITDLKEGIQKFQKDLDKASFISLDIETTGLDPILDRVVLVQAKVNDNIYLFDVDSLGNKNTKYILSLINSGQKLCILQNAKFDLKFIFYHYGELITKIHDTFISEIICTNGLGDRYPSLKFLLKKYLNIEIEKDIRASFINYDGVLTQEKLVYSATDVNYLHEIMVAQLEEIDKSNQKRVYDLEMRVIPVVVRMELNGIKFDLEAWLLKGKEAERISREYKTKFINSIVELINFTEFSNALDMGDRFSIPAKGKKIREILKSLEDTDLIRIYFVENFKISSPIQCLEVLRYLGFDITSTEEKVLTDYKDNAIIDYLLKYREAEKKVSTYGDSFSPFINPVTKKIHTEYHTFGGVSGRFSSKKPNLQNIPREEEYRNCFLADDGYVLISCDYSQQEYRLAGAVTGEKEIINAYLAGEDIHTKTAAVIGKPRSIAKNVNFAILYGTSAWGLSKKFEIPLEEADEMIEALYKTYSTLAAFKSIFEEKIIERKLSVTPLGRKRYFEIPILFPDASSYRRYMGRIKREGFNHPFQGGGADIIKIALCNIFYNNPFGEDLKPLLQVHDEIICMVKEEIKEPAQQFILDQMLKAEQPFLKEIPAAVDSKISKFWTKGG